MKRVIAIIEALGVLALFASLLTQAVLADDAPAKADASVKNDAPADRVVVMYFHRTQRCPTCLKMGSYSEEAVKSGFASEVKSGKVEFHYIDFEDAKNAAITKGYKVGGPSLIVVRVADSKAAEIRNLAEIWTKVRDKAAFVDYVQSNVKVCQKK